MKFQAPKGVSEYVPPRSALLLRVREAFSQAARGAGYGYLEQAVFEDTDLFKRGVGESTDVVTKEMYTFEDRGGRSITLRPEFTAGLLRCVTEHGLLSGPMPVKVWTAGPAFRYERPQAGRYRQFYQFDLEALGTEDPAIDAEVIALGWDVYARDLGLTQVRLFLNSLGDAECRPVYRKALQDFLRHLDLDEDTRQRIEVNPLRVLDDKRPEVKQQTENAPVMADYLCGPCKAHHDQVRELLGDLGVEWTDSPRLVRGLDYYTRTTFEFDHPLLGAQSALGGGGRYDGLSESIGGPPLPGIGFAPGLDRIVLALEAEGLGGTAATPVQVFGVPLGDQARRAMLAIVTELRRGGVSADMAFGQRGMKGAMKAADRSGARYAILLGERELEQRVVQIKNMENGEQLEVAAGDATAWLRERTGAR
jgi:histidyl-tRNA synthetase